MKHFRLFILFLLVSSLGFSDLESRRLPFSKPIKSLEESLNNVDYIFCLDFGGSKTTLHILDHNGQLLPLQEKNGNISTSYTLQGANINYVGIKGFEKVLHEIIVNLSLATDQIPLKEITSKSAAITSIAGLTRDKEKKAIIQIISTFGFPKENVYPSNDRELAFELIEDNGLILISSSIESICFGKEQNNTLYFGGLGPIIGGSGSGYHISIEAIKAAIANELGWGTPTSLTEVITKHFNANSIQELIPSINSKELNPYKIASLTPKVFKEAMKGDPVSEKIIDLAAKELGKLLALGLKQFKNKSPIVYCLGGIFTDPDINKFIDQITSSKKIKQLQPKITPLIINIAKENTVLLVVQEIIKKKTIQGYKQLSSLPILPKASYSNLTETQPSSLSATQLERDDTQNINATFQQSIPQAIQQLINVDKEVLSGFLDFSENHLDKLCHLFSETLSRQGRIFFVGSGSSGRVAKDLSARWSKFWKDQVNCESTPFAHSVIGVISGGPKAVFSTSDNNEDNEESGIKTIEKYNLNSKDLVILISSSGSPQFNIGVGKAAKKHNSQVCYILNSKQIPTHTQEFLNTYDIYPIIVDIGPPSIPGSTRLQGSSLMLLCLGSSLNITAKQLTQITPISIQNLAHTYQKGFKHSIDQIEKEINTIANLIKLEIAIFSHPNANFFNLTDISKQGYITFLGDQNSTREILLDVAEIPPTFSTSFPKTIHNTGIKEAEFRVYMLTKDSNDKAWEKLLQHPLSSEKEETSFILDYQTKGPGSFLERSLLKGNLLIAVLHNSLSNDEFESAQAILQKAHSSGSKTALIITDNKNEKEKINIFPLLNHCDYHIHLPLEINEDPLGIIQAVTIKQVLNLLSNGSMLGMHKIYRNRVIDFIPSSHKGIHYCIQTLQAILQRECQNIELPSEELLFHYITRAYQYKLLVESQQQHYSPSPIRLSLAMIKDNLSLDSAIEKIQGNQKKLRLSLF